MRSKGPPRRALREDPYMGREAECTFRRDRTDPKVKAILESGELILRGGIRRNIPIGSMHDLHVKGGDLCFTVGDELFFLALGSAEAANWAEIIAATDRKSTRLNSS